LQARRVFRLSCVVALSLALAYGLGLPLPFLAPMLAMMLVSEPAPPMKLKGLLGLSVAIMLVPGLGLLLIPLLLNYPMAAVLLVALGLYASFYLSVNQDKGLMGTLLALGITMISALGTVDYSLATMVLQSLVSSVVLVVICQWLVYPWFPEDNEPETSTKPTPEQTNWIALRGTLIVLPVYLVALTNPLAYMAMIMKSVALARQSSLVSAKNAGIELLGSTFLGGCFGLLFWSLLGIATNLWMFFLWMLLFGCYFSSKIYQLIPSRFSTSFWVNVVTTMLIVLGPAVEDSANGNDVYAAMFSRLSLFVIVTLYAWFAVYLFEYLHVRRTQSNDVASNVSSSESSIC